MTFHHDPFRAKNNHSVDPVEFLDVKIIFSSLDKARVKVKIANPDLQWYVYWGDGRKDMVSPGVYEIIHQYYDTQQGKTYEVKVSKGNQVTIQKIGY